MSDTASQVLGGTADTPRRVLSEEHFYWSVIDPVDHRAPLRDGPIRNGDAMRFAFEDHLPVSIDDVACACARVGTKFVACGLPRESVPGLIGPRTQTLTPATIPPWILEQTGTQDAPSSLTHRLNLLTREHEPPAVRRARRRLVLQIAIAAALLMVLVVFGVQRRTQALSDRESAAEERIRAAYARVLPVSPSAQPPAVRLASELRSLERLTVPPGALGRTGAASFDAALSLSRLLARVPDMHLATESLDMLGSRATLVAVVPGPDDAQRLAAAFDGPASAGHPWRLLQPQIASERASDGSQAVRVTLTLEAAPSAHHSAPKDAP